MQDADRGCGVTEACCHGKLRQWDFRSGTAILEPYLMLLTEASATRQFCFPKLQAQSGGKLKATPTGFPNLSEELTLLNSCNSCECISQSKKIVFDLSDFPEVISSN